MDAAGGGADDLLQPDEAARKSPVTLMRFGVPSPDQHSELAAPNREDHQVDADGDPRHLHALHGSAARPREGTPPVMFAIRVAAA